MRTKTITMLLILALAILVLAKNQDEASFWFLGQRSVSKSMVIGGSLALGILFGLLIAVKRKSKPQQLSDDDRRYIAMEDADETNGEDEGDKGRGDEGGLSDEDRDYIRF